MELNIEVLWHTDDTRVLADVGLDVNVEDLERKTITFYSIDVISPYKWDDDNMFCKINAGGETWISAYDYEGTKQRIAAAKRLERDISNSRL